MARLGCLTCDRDDGDGLPLADARRLGWTDINKAGKDRSDIDWETHVGLCPQCTLQEAVAHACQAVRSVLGPFDQTTLRRKGGKMLPVANAIKNIEYQIRQYDDCRSPAKPRARKAEAPLFTAAGETT